MNKSIAARFGEPTRQNLLDDKSRCFRLMTVNQPNRSPANLIMAYIGGSEAHGAKLGATDDTDWYGLYIPPPELALGLDREEHYVFTTGGQVGGNGPQDVDVCLYTLMKWAGPRRQG